MPRGITVIPGGNEDTVTPLTTLSSKGAGAVAARQDAAAPAAAPAPAAAVPLRIMSIGASVTFGTGSTTGDSYRKDLQDQLVAAGQTVNYVGQRQNGNFTNNQVEATPGFVFNQIANASNTAVPQFLPNLILLDVGTNNCNKGGTVPDLGANVSSLINSMFAQSPGATVILPTVLVNKIAKQDACRVDVNNQYAAMATQMAAQGAKFVLVDMRSPEGPTVNDLFDTRHPNDAGYAKMANVWMQGIQQAIAQGFISPPLANGVSAAGVA
jgi:lysophospholipase L1-like esterase